MLVGFDSVKSNNGLFVALRDASAFARGFRRASNRLRFEGTFGLVLLLTCPAKCPTRQSLKTESPRRAAT